MFLFAVVIKDTRKAMFEIATVEELVHHLGNDRTQEAIVLLET